MPNPGTRVQNGGKTGTQKPLQYYEFSQRLSPNKNPRFRVVLPTQSIPCGILDDNSGQLYLHFGSSYKTSDFRVDNLQSWWTSLPDLEQQEARLIQLKIDNGPESSGIRTQFLKRIVDFSNEIGRPIQLLYYPPYHSKYNPIERCWGILSQHWNGTLLQDIQTLLGWAESMT